MNRKASYEPYDNPVIDERRLFLDQAEARLALLRKRLDEKGSRAWTRYEALSSGTLLNNTKRLDRLP